MEHHYNLPIFNPLLRLLMSSIYISINFIVKPVYPGVEILLAELSQLEFEMFEEIESGLIAYIHSRNFNKKTLNGKLLD